MTTETTADRLDRAEAIEGLKPWARHQIRTVYEHPDFPVHHLFTLLPDFEYPDHDHTTVGKFVRKYA